MNRLSISENRISRGLQSFFIFSTLLFLFANIVNAGEKNEAALYDKELFAPQVISNFGMGDERFRSLAAIQKRDLLEAKKTLVSFLKATQVPDADLLSLLRKTIGKIEAGMALIADAAFNKGGNAYVKKAPRADRCSGHRCDQHGHEIRFIVERNGHSVRRRDQGFGDGGV